MAKRERTKNVERMLKEGRGIGIGKDYIPLIRIQEVHPQGELQE